MIIVVPASGGFHLFTRRPRDRLRRWPELIELGDMAGVIRQAQCPLVGLIGTEHADAIALQVLPIADLVCIPEIWLCDEPDVQSAVEMAERIVHAHLESPIVYSVAAEYPEALPF